MITWRRRHARLLDFARQALLSTCRRIDAPCLTVERIHDQPRVYRFRVLPVEAFCGRCLYKTRVPEQLRGFTIIASDGGLLFPFCSACCVRPDRSEAENRRRLARCRMWARLRSGKR